MAFKIEPIKDTIVKIVFIGDFDDSDAVEHVEEMEPILNRAAAVGKSVDIIADAHQLGKISPAARKVFAERNSDKRIGRTAILGINRFLTVLIKFIVTASGRDNLRAFATEEEAIAWLSEK